MDPAQLKPIVLKLEYASEPPAGLDTPRSPSRTSHSGGLGKGLGVCISNKFPRDTAAAAGLGNDCPEETGFGFSSKPPIVPVMLEDRMAFLLYQLSNSFPRSTFTTRPSSCLKLETKTWKNEQRHEHCVSEPPPWHIGYETHHCFSRQNGNRRPKTRSKSSPGGEFSLGKGVERTCILQTHFNHHCLPCSVFAKF